MLPNREISPLCIHMFSTFLPKRCSERLPKDGLKNYEGCSMYLTSILPSLLNGLLSSTLGLTDI